MKPYEFVMAVDAYNENLKEQYEEKMTVAYNQAYWTYIWLSGNQPESLEKILGTKQESIKEMTPEAMLMVAKSINSKMCGEVR